MGICDRYADFVYRIATGDKRRRTVLTPFILLIFLGLVTLFFLAPFWVDRWLGFPKFYYAGWSIGLSMLFLVPGIVIMEWPVIAFFRTKGTPVPFNPPPKLITTGLYAYTRNPMLTGWFLLMLGLGILFGSLSLTFIFTPLFIVINVLYLRAIEEQEMEKKFGEEYLEYKKRVPMFIPRFKKAQS